MLVIADHQRPPGPGTPERTCSLSSWPESHGYRAWRVAFSTFGKRSYNARADMGLAGSLSTTPICRGCVTNIELRHDNLFSNYVCLWSSRIVKATSLLWANGCWASIVTGPVQRTKANRKQKSFVCGRSIYTHRHRLLLSKTQDYRRKHVAISPTRSRNQSVAGLRVQWRYISSDGRHRQMAWV